MDPSEYPTNVISFNNFSSINYEYFESQSTSSGAARKHLLRVEAGWRQDGRLVHHDPYREGLWLFYNSIASTGSPTKDSGTSSSSVDIQGLGLLQRESGIYEPASLARGKQILGSSMTAGSAGSSPSSSLENALRNAQALNAKATQTNASLSVMQEPPTPSPGDKPEFTASAKDVHEYFISAVLSSVVYFLCHDHNFIPLNSRTLILAPSRSIGASTQPGNEIELATLDISLTSLGVLVLKAHSDMALGLQTLGHVFSPSSAMCGLPPGAPLWLAPSGSAAKFYCVPDDKKLPGNLSIAQLQGSLFDLRPNCGINPLTIKSWQSRCLTWLSAKGLNSAALEAGGWLYVQILGGHLPYPNSESQGIPLLEELAIVPWPALLCFQTSNSSGARDSQTRDSVATYRDPLAFAENWFTSKDERAAIVSKRSKEKQAADALSKEQAEVEARALQSHSFSPAALRRGSNAGAIYPTPPDAPQHLVGATPSFDGNVSTPGNPNHLIAHETGGSNPPHPTVVDADTDLWGTPAKKEDRTNSTVHYNENDNDNEHENDNDNLFGDLGGDMFGTHITDDDFNFFDEPDVDEFDIKPPSPAPVPTTKEPDAITQIAEPTMSMTDTLEGNGSEIVVKDSLVHKENPKPAPVDVAAVVPDALTAESAQTKAEDSQHSQPVVNIPFNKEIIFQKLVQESTLSKARKEPRRASLFKQIEFVDSLRSVNEKYSSHGQFDFSPQRRKHNPGDMSGLPQTKYLTGRRKAHEGTLEMGNIARMLGEKALDNQPKLVEDPMDYLMTSDGGSPVSEQDDSSHTTDEALVGSKFGVKRKWEGEEEGDTASTFDTLAMDFEQSVGTPQSMSGSQLPLLDTDPADWALNTYFTSPEPDVEPDTLSDLERIATAQILADQAVSGTLHLSGLNGSDVSPSWDKVSATKLLLNKLSKAANSCLKDGTICSMRAFLDIQGIPILSQALRLPPRPTPNPRGTNGLDTRTNNPFLINPPQIEVRRSDLRLSILPSSVPFWENLGLGPSKGTKDIDAVCVYPNLEGVAAYASTFLDQMRSVYESSRFGSHDKVESKDIGSGLLPFTVDTTSQNKMHHLTTLKETATRLNRTLSSLPVGERNFVVYFVYPVDNSVLLVHICSAFQHLFNLYRKALSERRANTANELVLQLIPLDFITSPTSLAIPTPSKYFRLSMEVYDRCIDFTSSSSSPAIMLERPLPRIIDFKLNANPSASLLQENTCLHIAYAQSIDDRWITAAWTDNRGTRQMTASYCLGRKNEPISTPFTEVANEIWETTLQVVASKKIHWRIIIARVGVMDSSEFEFWTGLASKESNAQISLTLVTVQTDPSLKLLPAFITLTPNAYGAQPATTPVSTPQALQSSILSPENAPTPVRENTTAAPAEVPAEPDQDARLIDYTDQTWGAVLSHRLNNSNSLMETNPALISGYLIKRGGTNASDPPIVMEVNIVHSEVVGNPRTFHESLLREMLGYYRGLGTLARARGVVDTVLDIRPWHIAAAEKAVKTLYMLM
ncbi:mediator complex subunit 13 C-terminal-domain-containing protein [Cadophora sp. MPI-SDFR-AT-0126]|nr:mediator complex subunit 13 C-terminal-domain-containing protein [Leotiomycetes sp. MPI-SDFR-AT-0126]